MNIPKLDRRTKEDIVKKIEELSKVFTPEWNFDHTHPDVATTVALLYADMMENTIEKYNRTAEKNLIEFHNCLGTDALYSYPAKGYVCFDTTVNDMKGAYEYLRKDTVLTAQTEKSETITYVTQEPVCVWNAEVKEIFCEDTLKDQIFKLYSSEEQQELQDIPVYKSSEFNLQKHILYFDCRDCEGITEDTRGILKFEFDHENTEVYVKFLQIVEKCGLYYSTQEGFAKCQNLQRDESGLFFLFDIEHPPQKTQMEGVESYWFKIEFESIAMLEQLYIKGVRIGIFSDNVKPDSVFKDNEEMSVSQFQPFDTNPIPYSSVYFVCDQVLCHKGAKIQMEFRVDYEYTSIQDEDFQQEIDWKYIMKKSKFKKPAEYDVSVQSVVWEYFNGSGWVRLFENNMYSDVFDGKNAGTTVQLEFKCPDDIEKVFLPSGENYSIRARISVVDNYMKTFGRYVVPVVSSLRFKYDYERLPMAQYMITDNCMEQKLYAFDKEFHSVRTTYTRHANGKSLYFGFEAEPSHEGIRILFIKDKDRAAEKKMYIWEYFSDGQWKNLSCDDKTLGLSHTGVLLLHQNRKFEKIKRFGKECYWIRVRYLKDEDYVTGKINKICVNACLIENIEYQDEELFYITEEEGQVCKLSQGNIYKARVLVNEIGDVSGITAAQMIKDKKAEPVYDETGNLIQLWVEWKEESHKREKEHDKRIYRLSRESSEVIFGKSGGRIPTDVSGENVKIFYSICNGEEGNLKARHEFHLETHSNLITEIYNPMNLYGGINYENISRTLTRSAENLRMRNHACTLSDLEHMVMQAERSVLRVKGLSNRNARGKKEYGTLTMVVLLADMDNFLESAYKIRKYIEKKRCCNVRAEKFEIIRPWRIFCKIEVTIRILDTVSASEVCRKIEERLKGYFNPVTGGVDSKGWEIGSIPERVGINSVLLSVEGVEMVNHFYLSMLSEDGDEITDAILGEWKKYGMTLPVLQDVRVVIQN